MNTSAIRLAFFGEQSEFNYLPRLKAVVGDANVSVNLPAKITTWAEIQFFCNKRQITGVLSTRQDLLELITRDTRATLDKYAGSYFTRDNIEIVFLNPLEQTVTVPWGTHVLKRYCSKLCAPQEWLEWPEFTWELGTATSFAALYAQFSTADLIAVDIETIKEPLAITTIAYTGVWLTGSIPKLHSFVIELNNDYNLSWVRRFNTLPAPKIFQNGKYDCTYLLRYNAVPSNWLFDTATAMHCLYSEMPKDLEYLSAYFFRKGRVWKYMASGDRSERLEYNCRDTYATAITMCAWLMEAPVWAKTNYLQEFPLLYPCLLAELTGIKRDMPALAAQSKAVQDKINVAQRQLNTIVGLNNVDGRNFNVASPIQMKKLMYVLGCKDIADKSCDEKHLTEAAFRHPLIERILNLVLDIRGNRKLISTYLTEGKEFNGRILYALNPHGTATGRLASNEHHFWCGLQIQNIPRGKEVKSTLCAEAGFFIGECDLEQAESRDTGYISGDENIISAVSGTRDFHSVNIVLFFGKVYEDIYDDEKHKTKNKPLRDIAKRVNHGFNYNMGAYVLVITMGLKAIYEAARLLELPKTWNSLKIAEYLLAQADKAFPALKGTYYPGVIAEITSTKMLVSRATHQSEYDVAGWARYCFSDPSKSKQALNAYVAHPPQSLNAMTLNKAFMDVFYKVALVEIQDFRLTAQIHDSILFQFREGREDLAQQVKQRMEIPVTVIGYDGKERTFTVPASIKAGPNGKGAANWGDTE